MHGPPTLVLLPGMDGMGEIRAPLVAALANNNSGHTPVFQSE